MRFGPHAVWKYRFKNSDSQKGARGSYRLVAVYDREAGILFPIILYAKADKDDATLIKAKLGGFEN